jgi:hypothetical protein
LDREEGGIMAERPGIPIELPGFLILEKDEKGGEIA